MDKVLLHAEVRRPGRHASRELRQGAQVPAIVYGQNVDVQAIAVDNKELHKALLAAGAGLIALEINGGTPVQVLAREIQRHPTRHNALHVDFQAVSMTEKLRVIVPLVFEGSAPALEVSGIVLVRNMDSIEVECLPQNIPTSVAVDLSKLETADDSVYVRDLSALEGVRFTTDPEHVVVSLTIAAAEAEEVAEEEPAEVEVVSKGKKGEEGEGEG